MKKYLCVIPLFSFLFSYGQYDPSLWEVHDQTTNVTALTGLIPANGYDTDVTQVIARGAGSNFSFDWNDNSDTTYKYNWTNNNSDVLQIDFVYNDFVPNYNNISLFTIHWEDLFETGTTNRFIRDTNGVEQDHLSAFGYSVDFSEPDNRIVSFKVQADRNVNIRVDLIDINGKLSNWASPNVDIENTADGVDITNETKWETVVFSWDSSKQSEANAYCDEISDGYSNYWWNFNLNNINNYIYRDFNTPIPLDTNKIVGITITLDNGDLVVEGDQKTVYIKDLQIGAGNDAENFSPDSSSFSGLVYNYSDSAPYTAEIRLADVRGDFEIPATTIRGDVTYSVTKILGNAFSNCDSLTGISIPSSITEIDNHTFLNLENLKSISYSGSDSFDLYLGNLEYAALPAHMFNSNLIPFDTIPDLQKVIVTNGELTSQGFDNIRKAYRSLTYVDLYNSSNTVLPDFALENCYLIDTLFLPQHLEEIGFKSVAECAYLEEIAIPLSVTKIGDSAFKNCTSLDSLSFADPYLKSDESLLESIGNWAFYNCHALESLTVPEGVTEIGDGAFYGCTYVDQLNLPSSLLKIGDNAFAKCDHLKNITIHASTPPTIEARTFFDVNREIPVSVPEHSVESYSESVFWGEFVNYKASSVTTDISGIGVKDGVIIKNNNGILEITNPHNYPVEFFDITGQKISVDKVSQGVFIIRIGNTIQKIVL